LLPNRYRAALPSANRDNHVVLRLQPWYDNLLTVPRNVRGGGRRHCLRAGGRCGHHHAMTFDEILQAVIDHTKHERYRFLCSDESPDKNAWINEVVDRYYRITGNLENAAQHLDLNAPPPEPCCNQAPTPTG
jgi:hypothetical protein